jgi:hypothetical protein
MDSVQSVVRQIDNVLFKIVTEAARTNASITATKFSEIFDQDIDNKGFVVLGREVAVSYLTKYRAECAGDYQELLNGNLGWHERAVSANNFFVFLISDMFRHAADRLLASKEAYFVPSHSGKIHIGQLVQVSHCELAIEVITDIDETRLREECRSLHLNF